MSWLVNDSYENVKRKFSMFTPGAVNHAKVYAKASDALTASMVAAAGAGADKTGYLLACFVWADDKSVWGELERTAYNRVGARLAVENKWQTKTGKPYIRGLTRAALIELSDPKHCTKCKGHGTTYQETAGGGLASAACPACGGASLTRWSGRTAARAADIPARTWHNGWGQRYEQVVSALVDCHDRAMRAMSRALKGG